MNNKIRVRLQDGTIGVVDKFIVGAYQYDTQVEAEDAIKQEIHKQLNRWLEDNTDLLSGPTDTFLRNIVDLDYSTLQTFISLLKDLIELKSN